MSAYGARYTDTRGLLTGERVYTLGDTEQEYTVRAHYYDERGRIVQSRTTNHLGGYDSDYYKYSFTGQTVKHRHEHSAPGQPNVTEVTDCTYDHADRLLTVTHTLNGGTPVTLASNQYDAIGRLGSTMLMGASALTTAYGYNVRSWPKTVSSPLFSQTLYYEDGTHPRWGGSIASQEWDADGTVRRYDYAYDGLSRLLRADYSEAGGLHAGRYSTRYAYDRQGNLTEIVRHGLRGTETTFVSEPILLGQEEQQAAGATASPVGLAGGQAGTATPVYGVLDSLTLTYRGNRLLAVENRAPRPTVLMSPCYSFVDGAHAGVEYAYDANGNMTQDLNKGLSAVSYNMLNLPERYVFAAGDTTSCTYNAAGEKLRVSYSTQTLRPIDFALGGSVISPQGGGMTPGDPIIVQPCVTTTYDYCGNLVYQDGVLKYLLVDGGFVTFTKTGTGSEATYIPTYHAYLRDHLGSNRVVASSTGSAEQVYHYYPYGSMFNGGNMLGTATTPSQPWLYCNKELDTMHGLGWYDSKARTYDPVLGIFPQMDPLAEKYHPWSPYVYCKNNPVNAIDPDGRGGLKVLLKGAYKIGKSVAKNGLSSLGKGATYATAFNDVVDDVKTVFDSKASTGDRVFAGFSLLSEVISPVSYKDAKTIDNAANRISRRILPNGGNAKPHGGKKHNDAIDEYIKKLKESGGNSNIRKNQKQVDASGNTVGNNRPDIQYDDENGVHHNIEFDYSAKHSARHKRTIESNDGQSDNIFIILDRNHDK